MLRDRVFVADDVIIDFLLLLPLIALAPLLSFAIVVLAPLATPLLRCLEVIIARGAHTRRTLPTSPLRPRAWATAEPVHHRACATRCLPPEHDESPYTQD